MLPIFYVEHKTDKDLNSKLKIYFMKEGPLICVVSGRTHNGSNLCKNVKKNSVRCQFICNIFKLKDKLQGEVVYLVFCLF